MNQIQVQGLPFRNLGLTPNPKPWYPGIWGNAEESLERSPGSRTPYLLGMWAPSIQDPKPYTLNHFQVSLKSSAEV